MKRSGAMGLPGQQLASANGAYMDSTFADAAYGGAAERSMVDHDQGPQRYVYWTIALTVGFVVAALVWAAWATLDVAVRARGVAVPPKGIQVIQSLEGGIVSEMLVNAGDPVRAGQTVARLDPTQASAELGESAQTQTAALLGLARIDALLRGQQPTFAPELADAAPDVARRELQNWQEASRSHRASIEAAQDAVRVRQAELLDARNRLSPLAESLRVAEESFAIEDRLLSERAGSRADHLAARQRLLAARAELEATRGAVHRLTAAVAEARANVFDVESRARAQWSAQRSELAARAATLNSTVAGKQDRLSRRDLVSPVDGVVNRVMLSTRGSVATPATPILEIVPNNAEGLMDVRVSPGDVGFIRVGQSASIQVMAYDSAIYGRMEARVERVSADAIPDERGEPYFLVRLVTAQRALRHQGRELAVSPGMSVEAAITTGERTVLQYSLKPVLRSFGAALRER